MGIKLIYRVFTLKNKALIYLQTILRSDANNNYRYFESPISRIRLSFNFSHKYESPSVCPKDLPINITLFYSASVVMIVYTLLAF